MADARDALENLLGALGESSLFVTSGSLTPVLPGLEVKGTGSIGFPVSAADAKRLIAKSQSARTDASICTSRSTGTAAISDTLASAWDHRKPLSAPRRKGRTSGGSSNLALTKNCSPTWKRLPALNEIRRPDGRPVSECSKSDGPPRDYHSGKITRILASRPATPCPKKVQ
jgi:hypothetical protein